MVDLNKDTKDQIRKLAQQHPELNSHLPYVNPRNIPPKTQPTLKEFRKQEVLRNIAGKYRIK